MSPSDQHADRERLRRLRTSGYDDAVAGRSRVSYERVYLEAFRRGQERREELLGKKPPDGLGKRPNAA